MKGSSNSEKIIASALILSMLSTVGAVCFANDEGENVQAFAEEPQTVSESEQVQSSKELQLGENNTISEDPESDDFSAEERQATDEDVQDEQDADSDDCEAAEEQEESENAAETANDPSVGTRIKNWFKNDVKNFFKNNVKNWIKDKFEWLVVGAVAVASVVIIALANRKPDDKQEKTPEEKSRDEAQKW